MAASIDTIAELSYGQGSLARIGEAAGTSKGRGDGLAATGAMLYLAPRFFSTGHVRPGP